MTRTFILPFCGPKDLTHTSGAIAHRFEHHLKEIRQKRLARIERLLEGLKSVGEMTPEAAQELVYDRLSLAGRKCMDRFDLLDAADLKRINRRAGNLPRPGGGRMPTEIVDFIGAEIALRARFRRVDLGVILRALQKAEGVFEKAEIMIH